ncbi:hypothetical protein DMH03_04590 [Amycolatopsis sp. WAC 01376]|nr:hypothetical protein DMH03_04590 [Amycolatopsis sp. WAC 01376]
MGGGRGAARQDRRRCGGRFRRGRAGRCDRRRNRRVECERRPRSGQSERDDAQATARSRPERPWHGLVGRGAQGRW